jgi:alpha-glucosidase
MTETHRSDHAVLAHWPVAPWRTREAAGCRVRVRHTLCAGEKLFLRTEPDNEELFIEMRAIDGGQYEAQLPWDPGNTTTIYAFRLQQSHAQLWLAADGLHRYLPPREVHFRVCRDHTPPAWVQDQIAYQIFPDRFHQGNAALAVTDDEYVYRGGGSRVVKRPWGEPVPRSNMVTTFFGGDLPGVQGKLDYLQHELGVTMLYLNPIFQSGSNHRYDTDDYFNVDPHLGGNSAFVALTAEVQRRGMRILLDAVVNHTSDNHVWFNRWGHHGQGGAYRDPLSHMRHWYCFRESGEYAAWKGFDSLPVLDLGQPAVQDAIYNGGGSVLRHWMRPPYRIDGWRIDVAHMLGEGEGATNNATYLQEFRRVMREERDDAYLLGEQFNEATRWLQGEQQDGAMNYYGFTHPLRAWLAGVDINDAPVAITTPMFDAWLAAARARIPYENQLAQLNLLDSHDTARFLTLVQGDIARMLIAVTLQMTYPGVPSIYYGDEIGIEGGRDPDCRRCFDWDQSHWNQALFQRYRRLIQLRHAREELRRGAFVTLHAHGEVFAFARMVADRATVVIVNRGRSDAVFGLDDHALPFVPRMWTLAAGGNPDAKPGRIGPAEAQIWLVEM